MSSGPVGHRPGGLTALAVLNFVFGGLAAIGFLAFFALLKAADDVSGGAATRHIPNAGLIYFLLLLGLVQVVLEITSGVGYLGQKAFLGKTMGNAFAAVSILGSVVSIIATREFSIFTIIGLIYPVLTLVLLNTTFKDDFPNP